MVLARWDPFREMAAMREMMDRLFEESFTRPFRMLGTVRETTRVLPLDVYETDENVVVRAALPGAKPEDVEINVTGDALTIKGRIHSEAEKEEARKWNWICNEVWYGEFVRTLTLPIPVQADKAEATFEDGILTLTLPKAEEIKPKQIKVKARETITAR